MSSVEFAATALKRHVAPRECADTVKERIRIAARKLGWSFSRTKDVWYADPRVSIDADELRAIEDAARVRYAREQFQSIDQLIADAEALLAGPQADFYRPLVDGFRKVISALHSA